jgi:hypothetical protein
MPILIFHLQLVDEAKSFVFLEAHIDFIIVIIPAYSQTESSSTSNDLLSKLETFFWITLVSPSFHLFLPCDILLRGIMDALLAINR